MDTPISTSTKPKTKRASRYIRPAKPRPMRLTPRDLAIIKAVNDFRVSRQDQIQRLLFPSKNTAQVRLQLLWHHGYLKRDFLPVVGSAQTSPTLYAIDSKGAQLLRTEFGYSDDALRLSKLDHFDIRFLQHTTGLAETRLRIELANRLHGYAINKWLDEKALKADYDRVEIRRRLIAILPDAYLVIGLPHGKELHFFVEYDTGSESLKVLSQKLKAYWLYFQKGQCKTRYGTNQIRVLIIIDSQDSQATQSGRIKHLLKVMREVNNDPRFWFTTSSLIANGDILTTPIWTRADRDQPVSLVMPAT